LSGVGGWRPAANPWLIAIIVTLAAFMEVLDTTIVNVSLPYIAGTMSASNDQSTWTLTSYLVANGIVLPLSGWLSSLVGRKRFFMICIAMFTLCSLLCGLSTSLAELVVFRLLQGFFGGGLQPSQQSIILDTFPKAQLGRAFGVVAMAIIVAPVIGPTLGGWLTDHYNWRWIFFINVPMGLITFFGVGRVVEDPPWLPAQEARRASQGIDYIGLALIALGFGALQVFMDRGEDADWFASVSMRLTAVVAAAALIGGTIWLWRAKHPVVNIRVLRDRNFAVGCLMIFATGLVLYSSAVIVPLLAQTVLGYTALLSGLLLAPGAALVIVTIPFVIFLMTKVQTRLIVAFGFFVLGMALVFSHRLVPGIDFRTLLLMRTTQSFGLAFLFVPISTITFVTLPKGDNADATALFTMFRNVAGSIGIAAASALLTERAQVRQATMVPHLTPLDAPFVQTLHDYTATLLAEGTAAASVHGRALGAILQTLRTQASVLAYTDVFAITAIIAFCVVPLTFLFTASRGGAGPGGAH